MKDEFYYKLLNIGKDDTDIEVKLSKIVKDVVRDARKGNRKLVGLCKVIATNVAYELEKNKIDYRVVNLYDYDLYDHEVILVRSMNGRRLDYFLIDPTFIQFKGYYPFTKLEELNVYLIGNLLDKGFSKINNADYNNYFKAFGYDGKDLDMRKQFLEYKSKRKK